ncbi:MAG: DUF4333 domain-containing protein [Aeromicrobium erythreum]
MRRLPLLIVPLVAVAACSFSAGTTKSVDGDTVAEKVKTQLTKQVGTAPDSVECPDDLKAEKGATTRCTLTAAGDTYGVTVTTTSAEGRDVRFSIKVDDTPQ